jgi:hypothetical protein
MNRAGTIRRARTFAAVTALAIAAAGCWQKEDETGLQKGLETLPEGTSAPAAVAHVDTAAVVPPPATSSTGLGAFEDTAGAPGTAQQPPAPPVPAPTAAQPGEWTTGAVAGSATGPGAATLVEVRSGPHEEFDRVVFDFGAGALPGYRVEYVRPPITRCGSGQATQVAGAAWLRVHFTPAQAHTDAGQPTITQRERVLSLPVVRELELTCDFEGHVEWVLGVGRPNRYRVLELSSPARVVVDVRRD